MTLAQNLRLLLSGNKRLQVSILLPLLLFSAVLLSPVLSSYTPGESTQAGQENGLVLTGSADPLIMAESVTPHPKGKIWTIGVVLPFHLDSVNYKIEHEAIPIGTMPALFFYEGFLVAMDSLKRMGMDMNVYVFDSKTDTTHMQKVLEKLEALETDVVIGPVVDKNVQMTKEFFKEKDVVTVSPLLPDTTNYPYYEKHISMNPSYETHADMLAKYILFLFKGSNYLTLRALDVSEEEKIIIDQFNSTLQSAKLENLRFPMVRRNSPNPESFEKYLTKDTTNVIFVPSMEESYLYKVINSLNILSAQNYKFVIFGPQEWLRFYSMDVSSFVKFNIHLSTNYWVDYESPLVKQFRRKFKSQFKTEPNKYAFQGFDIFFYLGRGFLKHHKNLDEINFFWRGLSNSYQLAPITVGDSVLRYENKQVSIIRFGEEKIEKAR